VFNTALTGYQEILTDPSYCKQIVTLTYPHIGNYGVSVEDVEATKVHAAGLIIKDLALRESNFRSSMTLTQYLQRENTVAIAEIDTRRLTRVLRTKGAQNGCILTVPVGDSYASLIVGGWGGSLCGISSIDDKDAARNDTRTIRAFKTEKWYHIRFRIYADRLQAWIDKEKIVDVSIAGHKVSLRAEVLPSRPLGISAYQTSAGLKNIQMRKLTSEEIAAEKK